MKAGHGLFKSAICGGLAMVGGLTYLYVNRLKKAKKEK